ncbi:MAG: 6-phosphogluconolactonase [Candidatus Thiothrix putei]|uniref:6-phosphogluconolactonase n=1 Tax=Candidatus Thiothrix putei TaxID=3080811 RepID=A0AA95KPQ5_9GAMM|nr:MAG: 6-phosphogluconolactonase [Candidatus Thiothrix putei]
MATHVVLQWGRVMLPRNTQVLPDAEAVAQRACELLTAAAQDAIRERGVFRLVLAGGGTPQRAYDLLAKTAQDWDKWEIFWGDERCLPVEHLERNSRMSLPTQRRFPIPAELGAEAAAAAYAQTISNKLPFDVVLLGMGEDGHTASLFPGFVDDPAVLTQTVFDAPKPPPERVSLSVAALQACRQQLVLVTGAGKIEVLVQWRNSKLLPIVQVVRDNACLLVDAAAYGE